MKKILIHSPYWEIGGGGERYSLTVAESLQDITDVFVTVSSEELLRRLENRLDLDLRKVKIFDRKIDTGSLIGFNGIFWVSDGSVPFLPVATKVIHFQAPFRNIGGNNWRNKLKLLGTKIVCNSNFTKKYIDQEFGIDSLVIYPPVEVGKINQSKKQNLIVTVGRFSTSSQNKRPEILVKAFRKMISDGLRNWRLVVVGIVENEESQTIATALRTMSRGYPIAVKTDLTHQKLIELYSHAMIYWHAAGYGVDLSKHPEKAEHFGISTVEAMAGGAVPIVFGAGGQLEIIEDGKNGLLWDTPENLVNKTLMLVNNFNQRKVLAEKAIERSHFFDKKRFSKEIRKLFV